MFFLIHEFKNNYILFDIFNKVEFFIGKSKTHFLKKNRNTVWENSWEKDVLTACGECVKPKQMDEKKIKIVLQND